MCPVLRPLVVFDLLDRDAVHARCAVIGGDQKPRRPKGVGTVDSVVQRVKSKLRLPLGLFSQLPSQTGELRRQTFPRIVRRYRLFAARLSSVGCRVFRSGSWIVHLQAVLLSSYVCIHVVGLLRSTGITRRHHYYGPRRLPIEAARPVMDFRPALSSSATSFRRATGLLASWGLPSSQHNFQRPPPPITPDRPTVAYAYCFAVGNRLRHSWKVGHGKKFNEAESGSRFRIAADVFADTGTPPVGLPLPTSGRLRVKTGNLHGKLLSAYKLCQASWRTRIVQDC